MASTFAPPVPTPSPRPTPGAGPVRFVAVRANLLPDEIVGARQTVRVRRRVLIGLGLVVALLIGLFGLSRWETSKADSDLSQAEHDQQALQLQEGHFAKLLSSQQQVQAIQTELQRLMQGDLSWQQMLTTLRTKAPAGVQVTSVAGTITAGGGSATSSGGSASSAVSLNQTGQATVGSLLVAGSAPDKGTVAAYADQLATVTGLTAPLVTSVNAAGRSVSFTLDVVITAQALGGRYKPAGSTSTSPTGGN